MKATVIKVPGGGFEARADSGHTMAIDWGKDHGGTDGASTPVEMVLSALGACGAIDVLNILEKSRTPAESLRVELEGDRADDHPRKFTKIRIEYVVKGKGIRPAVLERAVKLSEEKYCSVAAMLRSAVELSTSFRLEE